MNKNTLGNLKVKTDITVEVIAESQNPVAHENTNTKISY